MKFPKIPEKPKIEISEQSEAPRPAEEVESTNRSEEDKIEDRIEHDEDTERKPELSSAVDQGPQTPQGVLQEKIEAEHRAFEVSVDKVKDLFAPVDTSFVLGPEDNENPPSSAELQSEMDTLVQNIEDALSPQVVGALVVEITRTLEELGELEINLPQDIQKMNILLDAIAEPLRVTREAIVKIPAIQDAVEELHKRHKATKLAESGFSSFNELSTTRDDLLGKSGQLKSKLLGLGSFLNRKEIASLGAQINRLQNLRSLESESAPAMNPDILALKKVGKLQAELAKTVADSIIRRYEDLLLEEVDSGFEERPVIEADTAAKLITRYSAVNKFLLQEEQNIHSSFQEMADFALKLPQSDTRANIKAQYGDILGKLVATTEQEGVATTEMSSVNSDIRRKQEDLFSSAVKRMEAIDEFITKLDTKQWAVFRENSEIQELLGSRLEDADHFLGNTIMQKLLEQKERTDNAISLGRKLLYFSSENTLPVIILNAYREPGFSGENVFLEPGVASEKSTLFKLVDGFTEDQMQALSDKNIPGVIEVIELIKNNPESFRNEEGQVNQQIMQGLKETALHYLESGDERMQFYMMGLLGRNFEDLGDGYAQLTKILLESDDSKVQEALIDSCMSRARRDEKAIAVLVENFSQINPELQGKIQKIAPYLFDSFRHHEQPDPENIEGLSRILEKIPQELLRTLSFIKGVEEGRLIYPIVDSSTLNQYMEIANNPDMLPFIEKLFLYGYSFSPVHAPILAELLAKQDLVIGQLEEIKQDFPDFVYDIKVDFSGGSSRLLSDPYEMMIHDMEFSGIKGFVEGFAYVEKMPAEYSARATEVLIRKVIEVIEWGDLDVKELSVEEKDRLLAGIFDLVHSRDLGEYEGPIYDHLVEIAGFIHTDSNLFHDSEELEGGIIIRHAKQIDEAAIIEIIGEGDAKKIFSLIYNFADTYRHNLDDEYYEKNIQRANSERDLALDMLENISDPRFRELATIRIFEYLLDPDLGDPEIAEQLLLRVTDPELEKHLRLIYTQTKERLDRGEAKYTKLFKGIKEVSPLNKDELVKELHFSKGEERDQLEEELQRVQETMRVSINIVYENLIRVLKEGRRFKSSWETGHRGDSYDVIRDQVERQMGIRAKGTRSDPHPVYGAVWSQNGRDENLGGAGGRYGESFIILKNENIKNRVTFTYDDSFDGHQSRMLTWEDASYAKAMMNISEGPYVEAQILGGVSIDDIESVNIPILRAGRAASLVQREIEELRQEFPDITFNIIK